MIGKAVFKSEQTNLTNLIVTNFEFTIENLSTSFCHRSLCSRIYRSSHALNVFSKGHFFCIRRVLFLLKLLDLAFQLNNSLPLLRAWSVLTLSLFDLALCLMLLIVDIGNYFLAPRMVLAFEFHFVQMLQKVLIWLTIGRWTTPSWAPLIIFHSLYAFFTVEHCTRWCSTFLGIDNYPIAYSTFKHLKKSILIPCIS